MKNAETPYERYLREQEDLANQLEERRRASEEAAAWDETRENLRKWGALDEVESRLRNLRSVWIRSERKRGKSLQDAKRSADTMIEKVRKML